MSQLRACEESFEKFQNTPHGERIDWNSLYPVCDEEGARILARWRAGECMDHVARAIAEYKATPSYQIRGKGPPKRFRFTLKERILLHLKLRWGRYKYNLLQFFRLQA